MGNELIVQIFLLLASGAFFVGAFLAGRNHMRRIAAESVGPISIDFPSMGMSSRLFVFAGTALALVLFIWRTVSNGTISLPFKNHFDAFLLLGLLLACMVVYLRWTRNLHGLAFFLLPMIAVLFCFGAGLTFLQQKPYPYDSVWTVLHILSIVVGSVCFAAGCVGGAVYLIASRQLKHRPGGVATGDRWIGLPPLASIEKINRLMVYVGFPALTLALITGALRIAQDPTHFQGYLPKIVLALLAWLVYAFLLQVPLAPAFRGPRAAWLSIIGFILFLGGYVAVVLMQMK